MFKRYSTFRTACATFFLSQYILWLLCNKGPSNMLHFPIKQNVIILWVLLQFHTNECETVKNTSWEVEVCTEELSHTYVWSCINVKCKMMKLID